jgi:hypothetical protein
MSRVRSGLRNGVRVAMGAALAAGLLAVGADSSQGQETPTFTVTSVSGGAFGLQAAVEATGFDPVTGGIDAALEEAQAASDYPVLLGGTLSDGVGPAPEVTLPPTGGGPFTDSLPSIELDIIEETVTLAGPLDVVTEGALGPGGFAASAARVEEVNMAEVLGLFFIADLIETECSADLASGPTGSTRIVNGLTPVDPLPENPAPNTVAVDFEEENNVGSGTVTTRVLLVLNEQVGGPNDITVNGARLEFFQQFVPANGGETATFTFDETVAQARCGLVSGPVAVAVEPTFTG